MDATLSAYVADTLARVARNCTFDELQEQQKAADTAIHL